MVGGGLEELIVADAFVIAAVIKSTPLLPQPSRHPEQPHSLCTQLGRLSAWFNERNPRQGLDCPGPAGSAQPGHSAGGAWLSVRERLALVQSDPHCTGALLTVGTSPGQVRLRLLHPVRRSGAGGPLIPQLAKCSLIKTDC